MRYFLGVCILLITLVSCGRKGDLLITGNISGLKKGTLYVQKVVDTGLVNMDSLKIDGDSTFEFDISIKEPQALYLHLDKVDEPGYDDRILFFAEPGEMTINTSLKNFEGYAVVSGSQNQIKWQEYKKMNSQFNNRNLDLIKGSFEAQRSGDQNLILAYDDSIQALVRRKYLYTGNFAVTNKTLEVAPFIVISQIPDASAAYLDTLYNSFPRKIRKSLYGKQLEALIKEQDIPFNN